MYPQRFAVLTLVVLFTHAIASGMVYADHGLLMQQQTNQSAPLVLRLKSEAFSNGGGIPRRHTGEGEDISPSFRWDNVPELAQELALIMDDPDAPGQKPWVHWLIYRIPVDDPGIAEGIPNTSKLEEPTGAVQGKNSWGTIGYKGPFPPKGHGTHHYRFTLYALSKSVNLSPGADVDALLRDLANKTIAKAEVVGVYRRD